MYPGGNIATLKAANSSDCCAKCRARPRCTSWTMGQDKICHLKDQIEMKRARNGWFTSGLPGKDIHFYEIKLRHGTCLTAGDGAPYMSQCRAVQEANQQWKYDRLTGRIKSSGSLCLERPEEDPKGRKVLIQACSELGRRQRWEHTGISGLISNEPSGGLCLSAPSNNYTEEVPDSDKVHLWPCDPKSTKQEWSMWDLRHLNDPDTRYWMGLENWTVKTNSLWCFSLMLPWGAEPPLLRMQLAEHQSIFACDESAVYSNPAIDLGGGVKTKVVPVDLHCPVGGAFHTVLNTPVFKALWDQVINDARYELYDWTVKVDPDAVFIPWRLTDIVWQPEHRKAQKGKGVFFQNCKGAFHGPVEILSRKAVETYKTGNKNCPWHDQEDWYLSGCLISLGVQPHRVNTLLADVACGNRDLTCTKPKAAFHPFKAPLHYRRCWANATSIGAWDSEKYR